MREDIAERLWVCETTTIHQGMTIPSRQRAQHVADSDFAGPTLVVHTGEPCAACREYQPVSIEEEPTPESPVLARARVATTRGQRWSLSQHTRLATALGVSHGGAVLDARLNCRTRHHGGTSDPCDLCLTAAIWTRAALEDQ